MIFSYKLWICGLHVTPTLQALKYIRPYPRIKDPVAGFAKQVITTSMS
ncbi:MAG: hypothetical protein OXC46_05145 [Thaumarchaeota archaeon]|nr:hypothetical protein [Nitrososphaerota archaeon]